MEKFIVHLKQYTIVVLGVTMMAFAVGVFYLPNKIVNGGVSGLSTILFHLFQIPPGLSFGVINIILLLFAIKCIGREFTIKTLFGASLLSVLIQVFSYFPPLTEDLALASLFGAVLYGIGGGLTFLEGGSTGGTDILSRLLQVIFPHIKIGKLLMIVDAMVVLASLLLFQNINLALWGIIALFISTFAVDWLIHKLNISKLAFVVTKNGLEVSKQLISTSPRGVTILDAKGAYTMDGNTVLMCALKEKEMIDFQKKILDIDPGAFIIFSESQQIVGNGFHIYR